MTGIEKKASLAVSEKDQDDDQKMALLKAQNNAASLDSDLGADKEPNDDDSDDDEILNLQLKLASSSPNKKLLDEDTDGKKPCLLLKYPYKAVFLFLSVN